MTSRKHQAALVAAFTLLACHGVHAQTDGAQPADPAEGAKPVGQAARTTVPIVIDGRLSESAWETAVPLGEFIQWQPHNGEPATQQTEVRILYDDANIYVGARCFDSDPGGITINSLERDFQASSTDIFGIIIDSLNDGQSGFLFYTNAAGAQHDNQVSSDGDRNNIDWDGVWDVETSIDEQGWIAELVIPFKTLRFSDTGVQEWGFNAIRRNPRTREESTWSPLPLRYRSITRVSEAGRLEGISGIRPGPNLKLKPFVIGSVTEPLGRARTAEADGGVDLKYGLTPSLTLDLTYRTDFAQVEVDEQQVNLTRFNLFFPEKREFFLENQGIFTVRETQGLGSANVVPFFSRRIGLSEEGAPIPILGGGRVSGRAGAYEVGVLAMKTEDSAAGPSSNFLVGRLRRSFQGGSTIGAIATSRDSSTAAGANRLYGADVFLRFFEKLEIVSYLFGTDSPERRGRNQARLLGSAWRGDELALSAQYQQVQPNFDPGVGFVRRTAMTHYAGKAAWTPQPRDTSRLRHYIFEAGGDYYADEHGAFESRVQNARTGLAFQNRTELSIEAENSTERLAEPFAILRTVTIAPGTYEFLRYSLRYNSDESRAISGRITASTGEFWNGTSRAIDTSLDLRADHHLTVSGTLNYNRVQLPAGDFNVTLVGFRVFYGFTPRAFLTSFFQYNAATDEFSSNTRFNIMRRPLSDLFIVYNERRNMAAHQRLDRALILKFTNMFDF